MRAAQRIGSTKSYVVSGKMQREDGLPLQLVRVHAVQEFD